MTYDDHVLPHDWGTVRIEDKYVFTTKPPGLRLCDRRQIAFVPMDLVPINRLRLGDYVMKAPADISSGTYFEEGDLLVSKITPCFENGKQGIATGIPGDFGVATTEVIPIKPMPDVSDIAFLAYYLLDLEVRHALANKMEGATGRQRLAKTVLQEWEMPFPPLPEQRAIAAVLLKIQTAVEVQDKTIATLRELKAATMAKLFREGLRGEKLKETEIGEVPESWGGAPLGQIARIGNGSTPSRTKEEYWKDGSIPWITSTKVHATFIREADEYVTELAMKECHLPVVRRGSIVVAITGQGKTLGNAAMVTFDTCINQHLAFAKVEADDVVPEYVHAYLQSRYQDLRQAGSAGGTTKGALTCGFLEKYPIPLPAPDEQRQIADIATGLFGRIVVAEKKMALISNLFRSILHLLMTGQVRVTPLMEKG